MTLDWPGDLGQIIGMTPGGYSNTWEWDVAAGSLIATEAGAQATDSRGTTPGFNNEQPSHPGFLAATSAIHTSLKDGLK